MPEAYDDEPPMPPPRDFNLAAFQQKKNSRSKCYDSAMDYVRCVQETSACVRGGNSVSDCMKEKDMEECRALRTAYFECRRGMLDMRTRIKGSKFTNVSGKEYEEK